MATVSEKFPELEGQQLEAPCVSPVRGYLLIKAGTWGAVRGTLRGRNKWFGLKVRKKASLPRAPPPSLPAGLQAIILALGLTFCVALLPPPAAGSSLAPSLRPEGCGAGGGRGAWWAEPLLSGFPFLSPLYGGANLGGSERGFGVSSFGLLLPLQSLPQASGEPLGALRSRNHCSGCGGGVGATDPVLSCG